MRPGCSIRLSTPPRLSPSCQTFVAPATVKASSFVARRNEIIPPKSDICAAASSWPGWSGEAGVVDLRDRRRARSGTARCAARSRSAGVIRTASVFRPRSTSQRVERPGHAAHRVLEELDPLGDGRVVHGREAADHVRVAAEVLGRRVDDDVGAELERALEVRRRERVVDDDERADGMRGLGDRADVDDVEQRVRRRLEPDQLGLSRRATPARRRVALLRRR